MEGIGFSVIAKAVAEYGVLGLGWIAYGLQVYYNQVERKRYAELVIHIIEYFTKSDVATAEEEVPSHKKTFAKLFGKE